MGALYPMPASTVFSARLLALPVWSTAACLGCATGLAEPHAGSSAVPQFMQKRDVVIPPALSKFNVEVKESLNAPKP